MLASLSAVICALASAQPQHRPAPTFEINLDQPPEQRFSVIFDPAAGFNETVWEFYNMYFANNERLKEALYHLVATRGEEVPEMQGEIRGLAMGSKLPLPFVQGIQMLYELQTVMVPIVNMSRWPKGLVSTLNYTFKRETVPPEWAALSQIPWRGPGCTGIIATNTLDGTVSRATAPSCTVRSWSRATCRPSRACVAAPTALGSSATPASQTTQAASSRP